MSVSEVLKSTARQATQQSTFSGVGSGGEARRVTSSTNSSTARLKVLLRLAVPAGGDATEEAVDAEAAITAALHNVLRAYTQTDCSIEAKVVATAVEPAVSSGHDAGMAQVSRPLTPPPP